MTDNKAKRGAIVTGGDPFRYLLAVDYWNNDETPDVIIVTGYDDNLDSQVCWVVRNILTITETPSLLMNAHDITNLLDSEHQWLYGLACTNSDVLKWKLSDDLISKHITQSQYAAIVARAGGRV